MNIMIVGCVCIALLLGAVCAFWLVPELSASLVFQSHKRWGGSKKSRSQKGTGSSPFALGP